MKKITIFFAAFTCLFSAYSQTYWGTNTTSPMTNEAIDIEIDASGNQYVAGYITGGTNFAPGVASISSSGNSDIYVAKYNPTGELIWVEKFGGNFSDRPTDLVIDGNQNVIITGQYFGQVTFGTTTLTSVSNSKDIFIAKLNGSGNVVWAISQGGSGSENTYGIATDNLNNIILTGQFQGNSQIAGQTLTSMIDPVLNSPNYDLFISKYSSTGAALWVKTGIAKYEERGFAVDCDASNNIFITGQFSDTMLIAGQTINNISYNVGFLAKFTPTGTLSWLNQMKAGLVLPYDLELNSAGDVYLTGDFTGNLNYITSSSLTTITNAFSKRIFIIKTNNDGQITWTRAYGSQNELSSRAIAVDNNQNVYITGYFKCAFSQFHNGATATFNSVGFKDAYLLQINNIGETGFAKTFGGKKDDSGLGIAISSSQLPVIAGSYTNNLNIPTNSTSNYSLLNNGFTLQNYYSTFVYLNGDATPNSFLTNGIYAGTPDYNYFDNSPTDSLNGHLNPNQDTVDFCSSSALSYETFTDISYLSNGPGYTYLWNTGSTNPILTVNSTGTYSVIVTREDGCSSGGDTIHMIHHSSPPLPLLTDNHGIATNSQYYPDYTLCFPDSLGVEFSNLCAGCSMTVGYSPTYSDTLMHYYGQTGYIHVNVTDAFCTSHEQFFLEIQHPEPYDTIQPYISFYEDFNDDDTIIACNNQQVHIQIYDYLTNPTGILDSFNYQPFVSASIYCPQTGLTQSSSNGYNFSFTPATTGWYTFQYSLILGYNNLCGIDTVHLSQTDSIYIVKNTIEILANDLLCPDGSVFLYADTVMQNFIWSGPGIEWTSPNNDSVQVSQAGSYTLFGNNTDSLNGCFGPLHIYFTLLEKVPLVISMNPTDGIICPNDNVYMWLPNNYIDYEWINPDGIAVSTTDDLYDTDQGFYYAHVTDSSGCILTTLPVEVKEFTTPSLNVLPTNVICTNEPITINVSYDGNANINWIYPYSGGNSDEIVVNQAGVYICEIMQCGIIYTDTVVIIDGSFQVSISATDTILCYNDTAIISATAGMSTYNWSNGEFGSPNLLLFGENTAGTYSVEVQNQYGCSAFSDTITIYNVPFSFPPHFNDTTVCPGADVTYTENQGNLLNWYDENENLLTNSVTYGFTNVQADTIVLAAYEVVGCSPAYQEINVFLAPKLANTIITGDSTLCFGASTNLGLSVDVLSYNWYLDSNLSSTDSTLSVNSNPTVQQVSVFFSNECYTDSLFMNVSTFVPSVLSMTEESILACNDDLILLETDSLFDTTYWFSNAGTTIGDYFEINPSLVNGLITVQGIDANNCPTNVDSINVIYSFSELDFSLSNANCYGDSAVVSLQSSNGNLFWNGFGQTTSGNNFTVVIDSAILGWNTISATDGYGCTFYDSIQISLLPLPSIILPMDTILCLNDWLTYNLNSSNIVINWVGLQPGESLPVTGNEWYYITSMNISGCALMDSIYIETVNCTNALPNVFSPNGDGVNEFYIVDEAEIFPNNELIIMNRWGEIVYQEIGYRNNWNGGTLLNGVYFVRFIQDRNDSNSRQFEAFVQIVR